MKQRNIIAANWKMYFTSKEALEFLKVFKEQSVFERLDSKTAPEVLIAPNFTVLPELGHKVKFNNVRLCAQNMHWEEEGAFTGEISAPMVKAVGCKFVIIGHSERRHIFGETQDMINKKMRKAYESGLNPILCVGETLNEHEKGETNKIILEQVLSALQGVSSLNIKSLVIAYEPVWAIGTGKTARPEQAQVVHELIRSTLKQECGEVADCVRIQYGGSVKLENIEDLMKQPDIDGVLVGGASLKPVVFARLVEACFKK